MSSKANHTRLLLCTLFLLAASCTAATGKVIYVDDDAAGANDGLSWTDPFNYLQDALLMALAGDEIRVAQGIYTPTQDPFDREATFDLRDGVSIIGGYAGRAGMRPDSRHIKAFATILSGDIDHNDDGTDPNSKTGNSRHVVTCVGRVNEAVLDGFTITSGYAWPSRGHQRGATEGGGLYCHYDCVFADNYASGGGAVALTDNFGLTNEDAARDGRYRPVFTRCIFADNNARNGGAIYNGRERHPEFTNCLFEDNVVKYDGGAIYSNRSSGLNLNYCVFRRNAADRRGGAIDAYLGSEMRIVNCLFVANTAGDSGGAISCPDSNNGNGDSVLDLLNCTFYGNTSPTFYKPPTNSAKQPDGSWERWSGSVITNCIFYNEPSYMAVAFEFGARHTFQNTNALSTWLF